MAVPTVSISDVNHAIQLALAPVFLLTGIAGMLNVMAGRLARIIDRGRKLNEEAQQTGPDSTGTVGMELVSLERRRHLASAAITACTLSALLVCTVIAALFLEVLLGLELKWLVGLLFTGATLALVVGLAYFLREVHLATTTIRIQAKPGEVNR
jgi:MFS family permease